MDIAKNECSIDGSSAATLSSENFPHFACWSGLACKNLNFISNNDTWRRVVHSGVRIVTGVASNQIKYIKQCICIAVLIKIKIKRPFRPGQYICTPTACNFLSLPARPNVWGTFHKFLGSPERLMCARSSSERKFQSSSYQHWPQGAGQTHAPPFRHSRCSPTIECSCKKKISMLVKLSHIHRPVQKTSHHSLLVLPVIIASHFGNLVLFWHPVSWSQLFTFQTQPPSCESQGLLITCG